MNLYILRHAIALPRGTPGIKDEDRPLTKDGKRKMKAVAGGMRALGLDPAAFLANNDATAFFSATGDLLLTGPTLTNVNDVRVILVDPT